MDAGCRLSLEARIRKRVVVAGAVINVAAALLVVAYLLVVFPFDEFDEKGQRLLAFGASIAYLIGSTTYAVRRSKARYAPLGEWLSAGRPAREAERRYVVRLPAWSARLTLVL